MNEHFDTPREYAATHCGYDVPPSQTGWPAMIYVAETDTQAREKFDPLRHRGQPGDGATELRAEFPC